MVIISSENRNNIKQRTKWKSVMTVTFSLHISETSSSLILLSLLWDLHYTE